MRSNAFNFFAQSTNSAHYQHWMISRFGRIYFKMNLLILKNNFTKDSNNCYYIFGDKAYHLIHTIGLSIGSHIKVAELGGQIINATIKEILDDDAVIVLPQGETAPPPPLNIELIVSFPRPAALKRIISKATSMGVTHIHLLNSANVSKSYLKSRILEEDELLNLAISGLEQAIATHLPKIVIYKKISDYFENHLQSNSMLDVEEISILASPEANMPISQFVKRAIKDSISVSRASVAIGPELGWTNRELSEFRKLKFIECHLGRRLLKVETATIAALSQLSLMVEN